MYNLKRCSDADQINVHMASSIIAKSKTDSQSDKSISMCESWTVACHSTTITIYQLDELICYPSCVANNPNKNYVFFILMVRLAAGSRIIRIYDLVLILQG